MQEPEAAGERFLAALARDRAQVDASAVCLIVAHPDDESIACGGQLARLRGLSVVLVTDGAPRNLLDAHAYGFDTAASYARARAAEFSAAMQLAKVQRVVRLEIPDQGASNELAPIARSIADLLLERRARVAVTHAFEGGHPDHDATAFAVHAASGLLRKRGYILDVLEVPLYRLGERGLIVQSFAHATKCAQIKLALDADARRQKRRLLDTYVTQRQTLAAFTTDAEWFRAAHSYDFQSKPNAGLLLYDKYNWGLTGDQWCALARQSLRELALECAHEA